MGVSTQNDVLNSPFDIGVHKDTFINYLEVIIDNAGVIHYAVPSHQEWLIRYICERDNITRSDLMSMCPKEFWFCFIDWLVMIADCISVWGDFIIGVPNEIQLSALKMLAMHGLYKGVL